MTKETTKKLLSLLFFLYPALVFFAVNFYGIKTASLALIFFLALRLLVFRSTPIGDLGSALESIMWIVLVYNLVNLYFEGETALKIYPALMSLTFFFVFFVSLIKRKPIIETFARRFEKNLDHEKLKYIWRLTVVWTVWLFINSAGAIYTTIWGSFEVWVLYNSVVFYGVSALLVTIDVLYRKLILSRKTYV